MANLPEHIHAFPLYTENTVFQKGVGVWNERDKYLTIGDGKTTGGIPVLMKPDLEKASSIKEKEFKNLLSNEIQMEEGELPILFKWQTSSQNGFYYINNGEYSNSKIDITNFLAINNIGSCSEITSIVVYYLSSSLNKN